MKEKRKQRYPENRKKKVDKGRKRRKTRGKEMEDGHTLEGRSSEEAEVDINRWIQVKENK